MNFLEFSKSKMGNSNSLPDIPGGGTDGYHVLRVQVNVVLLILSITLEIRKTRLEVKLVLSRFSTSSSWLETPDWIGMMKD